MTDQNKDFEIKDQEQTKTSTLNVELNDALFKFIDADDLGKSATTIAGKPRLLIVDIIKRFCKNYIALFCLIIILGICFACVIIPAVSPFSATHQLNNIDQVWLKELPPSYDPVVTEALSSDKYEVLMQVCDKNPSLDILKSTPIYVNND